MSSSITTMHAALGLIVFLVGLVIFTPFAYASTYEAWTEGLYDAESDDNVQAITCLQVVETMRQTEIIGIDVLVALLSLGDERAADLTDPSRPSARAPPAS